METSANLICCGTDGFVGENHVYSRTNFKLN